jgi:tetratricopeptide (TPR) repeat protein
MRRFRTSALALGFAIASQAASAFADTDTIRGRAEMAIRAVEADATKGPDTSRFRYVPPTPAQRVAAGDLLLRTGDYDRAIETLSKVLELYRRGEVPDSACADATFLIAEAYFESSQYQSARRHYREIFDKATNPEFQSYAGRSISRLVDIALRTNDLESLDYVFARLNTLPVTDANGSLAYARAKANYARHSFNDATNAVLAVPPTSEYGLEGQYLLGVILTKQALLEQNTAGTPAV